MKKPTQFLKCAIAFMQRQQPINSYIKQNKKRKLLLVLIYISEVKKLIIKIKYRERATTSTTKKKDALKDIDCLVD